LLNKCFQIFNCVDVNSCKINIFRLFNYVDFDALETRRALEQPLIRGWSSIESDIDKYLETITYVDIKSRLDKECALIVNQYPCYVTFLLHKIGSQNSTYRSNIQDLYMKEFSKSPFTPIKIDKMYSEKIIPELQANIITLNLNCSECFLEDRQVRRQVVRSTGVISNLT